jgi:hypothetical protein
MSRMWVATADDDRDAVACDVRCVVPPGGACDDVRDAYLIDGSGAGNRATLDLRAARDAAGIVLPGQDPARAAELLAAGARRVLLGEAALAERSLLAALSAKFGADRVGLHVPARRFEVSWSFETESNADFKVVTPSLAAPAWEVLRADGARTGTQALWWIAEMLKLGAAEVLLRVDIADDADLNLCAECVERFGRRAWIGPLTNHVSAFGDWIRYGQARQLALPSALYARERAASARRAPADGTLIRETAG